jgi:putative ABC transport system substrate-binding protein
MTARAQGNAETPRVGFVYTGPKQIAAARVDGIVSGIRAAPRAPARVEMVVRVTEGDPANIAPMVSEVIGKNVSVFLANGPAALRAAQEISKTQPIVAIDFETDPVAAGFAQSIARPGGNVTGVFLDLPNFAGKWIELLRECMPRLSRIAMMWDPATGPLQVESVTRSAAPLNIKTDLLEVKVRGDYVGAFAVAKDRGAAAVIMLSSPLVPQSAKDLAELSLKHKLPAITMFSEFPRSGGLFSYGPNIMAANRQIGTLAGKILAGAQPANLPIERPTTFELIVNARAAEQLGVSIPASIQARADEVIE